jgi:energy-coupling factor transporter transmembrane protein EcfT
MNTMIAPSGDPLPEPLAQRLRAELQPGETLIWTGRPVPALAARPAWTVTLIGGAMLIPGILIAGIIGIVVVAVAFATKSPCFALLLLPFLAVFALILLLLATLPFRARQLADNTIYALTNRRAILWQKTLWGFQVRSFTPQQLGALQRIERPDGTGDLIFEQIPYHGAHGHHHLRSVGFTALARVRDVEDLLRATLLTPPPSP